MRTKKLKNLGGRWSKVGHEIATYNYVIGTKDVAAIYPKETREGKIAWGYFIKRIGSNREINANNFTQAPVEMAAHYFKKSDAKRAVEGVVELLASSTVQSTETV